MSEDADVVVVVDYSKSSKARQVIAAISACFGSFGLGTALAWTSPALPHIDEDKCAANDPSAACDLSSVTETEAGWIGPLMPVGAALSGLVTGVLLDKIGRKWTMISYSLPFLLGFALCAASKHLDSLIMIYFGRLLTGFAGGAFALAAPLYIVEVSEPGLRGSLASLMQLSVTLGVAFVNALNINGAVTWDIISAACCAPPLLMSASVALLAPESPAHLLRKDKEEAALEALTKLRGSRHDARTELDVMRSSVEEETAEGRVSLRDLLTEGSRLRPLLVVLGLMFFQQFSGINSVVFYAQAIFQQAGSQMDPGFSSFLVSAAMVFGTGLAVAVVERFGRRVLLISSGAAMSASILGLAMFFFVQENSRSAAAADGSRWYFTDSLVDVLSAMPLVCLVAYVVAFSIGFGPLPWTVNAEIFPPSSRSVSSSVAFCFNWTCAFAVTASSPLLERALSPSGVYFAFAAACAAGTAFVAAFLPETKGRSPKELFPERDREPPEEERAKENFAYTVEE